MKKNIIFLVLALLSFAAFSQTPPPLRNRGDAVFTQADQYLAVLKTLSIPFGPVATLNSGLSRDGSLFFNTTSGKLMVLKSSAWEDVGKDVDLSGYYTKTQVDALLANYSTIAAMNTALSGKVDKTTTVNGKALSGNITLTKTDIGLGNVDDTSDANKPVSTATQTALNLKENSANKSNAALGTSTTLFPTQSSVKTYVDNAIAALPTQSFLLARANHTGTQAISTVNGLQSGLDAKINLVEKAAANGVATLGADGKIPNGQLPSIALTETFVVASQSAMLALSTAEMGDVAIRTDIQKSFILQQAPASTLANWIELLSPSLGNTDNLPEGTTNLYYTQARARSAISGGTGITYSSGTGVIANSAPNLQSNLSIGTRTPTTVPITNSDGTGATIPVASTTLAGVMSSADKTKLDGIAAGANTGTVTSVGLTVPTGLAVSGSPVTTSGTFGLTYAAGYAIPTTAKQTDWDSSFSWGDHRLFGLGQSAVTTDYNTIPSYSLYRNNALSVANAPTAGVHSVWTTGTTADLSTSGIGGQLAIGYSNAGGNYTPAELYIRSKASATTWNAWEQIATRPWTNTTFLPYSGGTLTGALGGTTASFTGIATVGGLTMLNNNNFGSAPFSIVGKNSGSDNTLYTYTPAAIGSAIGLSNYLPLSGGTLTGNLLGTTSSFSGNVNSQGAFVVNRAGAVNKGIFLQTSAINRWYQGANAVAETGGNVGSNWTLERFADNGSSLGYAIVADRNTGNVTIGGVLTGSSTANFSGNVIASTPPTIGAHLVNKTALDAAVADYLPLTAGSSSPLTDQLVVNRAGGSALTLRNTAGATGNTYAQFLNNASTRLGYVGFGSASNNNMQLVSDLGTINYTGTGHIFNSQITGTTGVFSSTLKATTNISIDGAAGSTRGLGLQTSGLLRGLLYADNTPESGANSGSLIKLSYYNDAGVYGGDFWRGDRSNGSSLFGGTVETKNLGITGTTNYNYPTLGTIAGTMQIRNGVSPVGSYGLGIGVWNDGNTWLQGGRFDGTATAYDIIMQSAGGEVGIGTTAPLSTLHTKGTTRVERESTSQYVAIDAEGGSGNILSKNTLDATYSTINVLQGNSTSNRNVINIDGNGVVNMAFGAGSVFTPTLSNHFIPKGYLDPLIASKSNLVGGNTFSGGETRFNYPVLKVLNSAGNIFLMSTASVSDATYTTGAIEIHRSRNDLAAGGSGSLRIYPNNSIIGLSSSVTVYGPSAPGTLATEEFVAAQIPVITRQTVSNNFGGSIAAGANVKVSFSTSSVPAGVGIVIGLPTNCPDGLLFKGKINSTGDVEIIAFNPTGSSVTVPSMSLNLKYIN